MDNSASYKVLITQLIAKQSAVLGPDITMLKVKHVNGLVVDPAGNVVEIQGDPAVVLKQLINEFVELSGQIVKLAMESIVASGEKGSATSATEMMHDAHSGGNTAPSVAPVGPATSYNAEMMATINGALSELNLGTI